VLKEANPDLILLDIQMIGDNSLDICRHLRSQGFAKSILMLASKNAELDIISCLEAGANDYIIKPLRMNELLVRIEAQLWEFRTSNDTQLALANLSFDPTNKMLQKNGGHCMETLTEKETIILQFLYHSFPGSVTKEDILLEVWGLQDGLTTHTLETHIYRLRQKISRLTEASLIITKENGYCLAL
jgi:DNA-binding response OmpR family regulator